MESSGERTAGRTCAGRAGALDERPEARLGGLELLARGDLLLLAREECLLEEVERVVRGDTGVDGRGGRGRLSAHAGNVDGGVQVGVVQVLEGVGHGGSESNRAR